ncbi:hypothetical protein [Candidatus Electronema sp. PJ]|uniref:hypothetical protein n=1 Tax=Candidatus Electronema sp. PJ TaxID=3401572 RepID=UPI003AA8736A
MKPDSIIADIRQARDEISERFKGDMAKIYAFFKEEEKKAGRRIKPLQRRSETKANSLP